MKNKRTKPPSYTNISRVPPPSADFRAQSVRALEQVSFFASLVGATAVVLSNAFAQPPAVLPGVGTLLSLAVFYILLARRWCAEWLVYCAEIAFAGSYFYYRAFRPLPPSTDAFVLVLFCFVDFGISEVFERLRLGFYVRPTLYFSLLMGLVVLLVGLGRGQLDIVNMSIVSSTATFYAVVSYRKQWKNAGYVAGVLYNAFLWIAWVQLGWKLADHPQFYLIPVGLSAILFAEVNRRELGRKNVNVIRSLGSMVIYVSSAVPMWQFRSLGAWLALLLLSLTGVFVGIGLRVQSFLWLGLVCFVFDVVYQLGRVGMEHAFAKWAIMVGLGILLLLFVALNEKKQIAARMWTYYLQARQWE